MEDFLLVLHVVLSFVIVIVILLQSGKGGGLGAGFNNAAALGQEVFGGRGAAGFLVKLTVVLGAAFMITSMALAWYSSKPQSALDLQMEAEEPVQSQVHDIIDEGSGEFDPGAEAPAPGGDLDLQMPGDDGDDAPFQIDVNGDGEEIPDEIREQLEEMDVDLEQGAVEPEVEEVPQETPEPEVEEVPQETPEPEVEEAPEPEVEEVPQETPEPEAEEAPEPEVEEAPEPEAEEAPEPETEE